MTKFHLWPVRIYYEDTDNGGVVYHANYLKFLERARTEWLRSINIDQKKLKEEKNLIFVVHKIDIKFKKPAEFNDLINVETKLKKIGSAKVEIMQTIKKENNLLVDARVEVAGINAKSFIPIKIPTELKIEMELNNEY